MNPDRKRFIAGLVALSLTGTAILGAQCGESEATPHEMDISPKTAAEYDMTPKEKMQPVIVFEQK